MQLPANLSGTSDPCGSAAFQYPLQLIGEDRELGTEGEIVDAVRLCLRWWAFRAVLCGWPAIAERPGHGEDGVHEGGGTACNSVLICRQPGTSEVAQPIGCPA